VDVHDLDVRIVLQILAQFGNVYVHASSVEIGIASPDLFQGMLPRQQIIQVFCQQSQQVVLFGRKGLSYSVVGELTQLGIEVVGR